MTTSTLTADDIGRSGEAAAEKWLAHFGRIGMHWGVRRTREQLATDPKGKSMPADPDAVKAVETAAKIKSAGSLNVVSSADLQQLVTRMNLEQKYIKASLETNPKTKKGDSFVKKMLMSEASYFTTGKKGPVTKMVSHLVEQDKAKRENTANVVKGLTSKATGKKAPKKNKKEK